MRSLQPLPKKRRDDAQTLIDTEVLDHLAVSRIEALTNSIKRWAPHADRLTLCVPWYGIAMDEQVETFRQVLNSVERM